MKYEDLLEIYEDKLDWIKRQRKFDESHSDYWDGVQTGFFTMYWQLLPLTDFKPVTENPTEEELKLIDPENGEKPYTMLVYRGKRVPIYADDYGQQDYIIYCSKTYGGGAYNFNSKYDFCYILDSYINDEITKGSLEDCEKNNT